jgi:hypothetical protein
MLTLGGCGGPPRAHTTFLSSVDLVAMTDQMATSFAADDVIREREPSEEPWIISINRVANHTNQIIPDREKWLYIARLRSRLTQSEIARERSLVWVIPPDRWVMVAEELGESHEPRELRMTPTHQLTAEFFTLTNSTGAGRSDAYLCSFQLFNLDSGAIVWEDAWEVKRAVTGRTYD